MSRVRYNPVFLRTQPVEGDPRDAHHPLILHLQTWKRLFDRARIWTHSITATGFTPPDATGQLGDASITSEREVVRRQATAPYPGWSVLFGNSDPPNACVANFHLHTNLNPQTGADIYPVREGHNYGTTMYRHALSLFYELTLEVEGVGVTGLTSNPASGSFVTNLILDPLHSAIPLPLYGTDELSVAVSLGPTEYWSYNGIYNTTTGMPRRSVWSNTLRP